LSEYVKNTFPHGLVWNVNGLSPKEAIKAVESKRVPSPAPAPAAGGPPPPPPPPPGPAPKFDVKAVAPAQPVSGGIGAVFSELNKGDAVTKGLKKVSVNEMTHKNPSLRASSIVPDRSDSLSSTASLNRTKSPAPRKSPKPDALRTKKPPKKELDGNKWIIENYDNESEPIEIEASISQSILISRCNKTTIRVLGKANAISIDNSPRLSLVIDSLVSSVDVIKSSNFALQVLGTLPTILLDQVDGAQVYLGKDSMNTEIFSSKSSSLNVNIIAGEDEDYKEMALPEQIRTYIGENGTLISEIVEHAG
jgi:adenylyl cyclase-associated protein